MRNHVLILALSLTMFAAVGCQSTNERAGMICGSDRSCRQCERQSKTAAADESPNENVRSLLNLPLTLLAIPYMLFCIVVTGSVPC